jgi:hypothetical protein
MVEIRFWIPKCNNNNPCNQNLSNNTHLVGGTVIRFWDQEICFLVVSDSSPVAANMMATGGLYDY